MSRVVRLKLMILWGNKEEDEAWFGVWSRGVWFSKRCWVSLILRMEAGRDVGSTHERGWGKLDSCYVVQVAGLDLGNSETAR
ncbi:hypothetical protein Droror1_Dr00027579 [Drosera rotundifolia]